MNNLTGPVTIEKHQWFKLVQNSAECRARLGEIHTLHGNIPTPVFMPVGSQGTVKAVTPGQLHDIGIGLILANTYHLYLRPGVDIIRKSGGLHRFMHWDKAILTDSGGFQIFSLARLREINEEGVRFRSHIDGSEHFITPEMAIRLQEEIGADIIMALDICPSVQESDEDVREATARTHRWAERCLKAHLRPDQALFGIVQGGFLPELRKESARQLIAMDFPGYAIGGLSLGEPKEITFQMIDITSELLPEDKPRYLMGVGAPDDILRAVEMGIDMFDSVLPTRVARNGGLFTDSGRLNIRNSTWKDVLAPVDQNCPCYTCRNFSAAYLHHLFRAEELLGYTLATIHNLTFMQRFMERVRDSIACGNFLTFKQSFLAKYRSTDEKIRLAQKQKWLERWGNKKQEDLSGSEPEA